MKPMSVVYRRHAAYRSVGSLGAKLTFVHVVGYVLAKTQTRPQMLPMRTGPSAKTVVRTAFAVLFGFMSLLHGPVMAFANSNTATHHGMAAHHAMEADTQATGHHHHAGHEHHSKHSMPNAVPSCYGIGCFIVLDAFAAPSPTASICPIGVLSPSIAKVLVAVYPEPVVPPPRIQV